MASSLYQVVEDLHSLGLLMSIQKDEEKLEDTLLLLNVPKLTNEVHKILFSEASDYPMHDAPCSMGVLTHSFLSRLLPEYISTDCLIQLQYCQLFSHAEVNYCDQSVLPTNDPDAPTLLYFPALCTVDRKRGVITPADYTYSIGWYAECQSKFQYFPVRYLHVLLLRLAYSFARPIAPSESEGEAGPHRDVIMRNYGCTMWKNGLHWHMDKGVLECIVELVSNSRGLVVITRSTEDEERIYKCAEMLFKIIDLAKKAKDFCQTIKLKQYLLPFDCHDIPEFKNSEQLFDLEEVGQALKEGKPTVLSVNRKRPIEISKFMHLKEFIIKGKLIFV